jgi:hypothetical protein
MLFRNPDDCLCYFFTNSGGTQRRRVIPREEGKSRWGKEVACVRARETIRALRGSFMFRGNH